MSHQSKTFNDFAVSEREAADFLGLKPGTLRTLRWRKLGPAFLKLGKAIRYRVSDLEHYAGLCRVEPGERP